MLKVVRYFEQVSAVTDIISVEWTLELESIPKFQQCTPLVPPKNRSEETPMCASIVH